MMEQLVLVTNEEYEVLDEYFLNNKVSCVFLVCDNSIRFLKIGKYFDTLSRRMGIEVVPFSDFEPNPCYESVVEGVKLFHSSKSSFIVAVGGGSAMDVAKCIKLFANMDDKRNYLEQSIVPNDINLLAVPTTAGTGSEATRYAVIYYKGEKQSISDYSCIPSTVLMDASVLKTLPEYQKKATMMDAMCHSIESFWSVNSTDKSKEYSKEAIQLIITNEKGYLSNEDIANAAMLRAANLAGKAINITQTTAGHAMCYKLTSLYGIAHGHAAALCVSVLWPFMLANLDQCIDSRGKAYLQSVFCEIADAFGCTEPEAAVKKYQKFLDGLALKKPTAKEEDFDLLKHSVNPVRLKNHPIRLSEKVIDALYHQILSEKG